MVRLWSAWSGNSGILVDFKYEEILLTWSKCVKTLKSFLFFDTFRQLLALVITALQWSMICEMEMSWNLRDNGDNFLRLPYINAARVNNKSAYPAKKRPYAVILEKLQILCRSTLIWHETSVMPAISWQWNIERLLQVTHRKFWRR